MKSIKLADQTIDFDELLQLTEWLKSEPILTKSKLTLDFEKSFSKFIGSEYSVFVNSGSSANLLMIYALINSGRLKNRVCIAPSLSWITTVSPFIQFNFETHLCDCDKKNLGLDISHLDYLCKKFNPSVIILCHVLGHANHMREILSICKKYDVILLEDTCESLGSEFMNSKLGNYGLASSFSFYYGHHISTIEGGMIVTKDRDFYNHLIALRSHGWIRDMDNDYKKFFTEKFSINHFKNLYTFIYPGFNLRSTDLNAFIGILQLKKIKKIISKREKLFYVYKNSLKNFWSQKSNTSILSSFAYATLVEDPLELFHELKNNNIESRPIICGNLSRHPFWKNKVTLPNSEVIDKYGIYLPIHHNLTSREVKKITNIINKKSKPIFFDDLNT